MTSTESSSWCHKTAARFASQHFAPGHVVRLLGVITRQLEEGLPEDLQIFNKVFKDTKQEPRQTRSLTLKQAIEQIRSENPDLKESELNMQGEQLRLQWKHALRKPFSVGWNSDGECPHKDGVSLVRILQVLEDLPEERQPTEIITLLQALLDLSCPDDSLYGIPLLNVHALWSSDTNTLRMGVYANRLLFEVMTQGLKVVLAALDEGSFKVRVPLQQPIAVPHEPAFCSAQTPTLVFDEENDDDEVEEEEQEGVLKAQGTRESGDTLSAFSHAGLLRLWENHGCNIDKWPMIRDKIQQHLQVELMLHQIHGVCWMLQQEEYDLNSLLWEQREFQDGGTYWYSPALGQVRLTLGNDSVVRGGVLADEMGLGKTLQMICLILASDVKEPTLIVVPPALVSQWMQEFEKIAGTALKVACFQATAVELDVSVADVIITTYQALDHNHHRIAARLLKEQRWGRVVLDEMQEIRSSTTAIAKNCEGLFSERRWMLSGTPIFEGITDLRGELCFLRVEPFSSNLDDGFFNFAIEKNWEAKSKFGLDALQHIRLFLLRRSKSMTIRQTGLPLLGLKPLTVTFEPVPQDPSERALYCFLEYLVHSTLRDEENGGESKNKLFLRLLRNLCVSVRTLSGGMGCPSELRTLNELMKAHNRRLHLIEREEENESDRPYSCDEAIRFLTHVTEVARVGDDFVTSLQMGGGGGIVRRQRAYESVEESLVMAKDRLARAEEKVRISRSKRAKALWHLALEKVTTGYLRTEIRNNRISIMWKWRYLVIHGNNSAALNLLPVFLTRGWRPSERFFGTQSSETSASGPPARSTDRALSLQRLYERNSKFLWAHPFSVVLSDIPHAVSRDNLHESISDCLSSSSNKEVELDLYSLPNPDTTSSTWKALVHFASEKDVLSFFANAKRSMGIPLVSSEPVPSIERAIAETTSALKAAEAEYRVYQCPENKRKETQARKAFERAQKGLHIFDKSSFVSGHVKTYPAFGNIRDVLPRYATSQIDSSTEQIVEATQVIAENLAERENELAVVKRLQARVGDNISDKVQSLSAFEDLQALKNGESDKTSCPLCFGPLGDGGKVAMTRCGHLFCAGCWEEYADRKVAEGRPKPPCMTCRKEVNLRELVTVDPACTADQEAYERRRAKARKLVQKAASMLQDSNGQLEPDLWEALYLSFELPPNADQSLDGTLTAIPGGVMAHIRHSTNRPDNLSSKIRALLEDLPTDERSVVFASSKISVKHLEKVFDLRQIGYRSLFTGQTEEHSESAIRDWQDVDSVSVLIVQAGAAACGLTLTSASKMFLLEPFLKYEEEQQAYGRLHRYGQLHRVECKVYYTPVSVESRLLEWRKQRRATETEKSIVYAPLRSEHTTDPQEMECLTQTRFLLGVDVDGEDRCKEDDPFVTYG